MKKYFLLKLASALFIILFFLNNQSNAQRYIIKNTKENMEKKVNEYATVKLTTDLSKLTNNEKKMISLLIDAAKEMDGLFAYQAYGNLDSLIESQKEPLVQKFIQINYGPWDRLDDDRPFIKNVGPKPVGANFYPHDMDKEDFEESDIKDKTGLYNFIRWDSSGQLYSIPYHEMFKAQLKRTSDLIRKAAALADNPGLKNYLTLRADALQDDQFQKSDFAWLDMKNNTLDIVIGPIETYEDQLFGYKAAYEGYVLVKDKDWSQRLSRYASLLPELQQGLPVSEKYKAEKPGSDGDLNAYDVIYYSGSANAGGKTIAINLPNDEEVQLQKGTRRLQLKNAMLAKFDKMMVPIANILITPEQRKHVTFDAFFANTMLN